MKDRLLLIVVSVCCAIAAWGFWRFSGQRGFEILLLLSYITLLADNCRLRKALRFYRPKD